MKKSALLISFLLLLASFAAFQGCDIIKPEDRIEWEVDTTNNDTINPGEVDSTKVVYIGDYTGHTCGNCPRAAEKATQLKGVYGDQLVVVALHVGNFAKPKNPDYPADYRTAEGTEMDAFFGCAAEGLPLGLVDQKDFSGKLRIAYSQWGTYVSQQLNETPTVAMGLKADYNATTREVSIQVDVRYLTDASVNENVVVQIIEDSIVGPQTDYSKTPDLLPDYVHNHMLQATVTSNTWGEPLSATAISQGDQFTKTWKFTLDNSWVANNCAVVAYVMDNSTKVIRNVREVEIGE
ncbi:MAG: Omp28 family outer membrane lipoprotein [Bacteroidia bacterium]|nr:Omp28 family outer membrane lipoprotein [Bacteroidia bacterium]